MKIGSCCVTALENNYRFDILTDELRKFCLDLLGLPETYPWVGSLKLGDIEFIYSGRKDEYIDKEFGL